MAGPFPNMTLEFAASASDIHRWTLTEERTRRSAWSAVWRGFEIAAAAFFLWSAWTCYFSWSSPYLAALFIGLAAYIGIPGLRIRVMSFVVQHLTFRLCGISEIRMRISVNDEEIVVEDITMNPEQPTVSRLDWQALIESGSARETADVFWLEYPTRRNRLPTRGVWIPKSAFVSDAECDQFRSLLSEKLGAQFRSTVS
jgi:hypothetical protein